MSENIPTFTPPDNNTPASDQQSGGTRPRRRSRSYMQDENAASAYNLQNTGAPQYNQQNAAPQYNQQSSAPLFNLQNTGALQPDQRNNVSQYNQQNTGNQRFTLQNTGARQYNQQTGGMPVFTPPNAGASANNQQNNIPTFTPPQNAIPTFTPPGGGRSGGSPSRSRGSYNGACCFYHQDEPSVANCARCGKHLCQDCYEAYGVTGGEYANQALCYDCTQMLVAENVEELTKNKATIKRQFIISLIGISIGFIFGLITAISGRAGFFEVILTAIIFAGIGGMFGSFIKLYLSTLWEAIKAMFSGDSGSIIGAIIGMIISLTVGIVKCVYYTIRNTIDYIRYLKRTSGFIESDQESLRQMRDYMEYSLVRSQNKGVDLETLMAQGSELYNNSFAQMVRDQGEEAATHAVSLAATRIAENGEIIRDFAA